MKPHKLTFMIGLASCLFPMVSHANTTLPNAPKALYHMHDSQEIGATSIYEYHPTSVYTIDTSKNYIADVELHPKETIQYIGGGDTVQWLIDTSIVNQTPHLYIKPLKEGIRTNIVVNTTHHTYHLALRSTNHYSLVSFTYPEDIQRAMQEELKKPIYTSKAEKEFLDTHTMAAIDGTTVVKPLNYKYTIKNHKVDKESMPLEIYDDGTRTYFKIPAQSKYNFPTLYLVDAKGKLLLVNYRVIGSYLVADRVFTKARLIFSPTEYLDVIPNPKEVKR